MSCKNRPKSYSKRMSSRYSAGSPDRHNRKNYPDNHSLYWQRMVELLWKMLPEAKRELDLLKEYGAVAKSESLQRMIYSLWDIYVEARLERNHPSYVNDNHLQIKLNEIQQQKEKIENYLCQLKECYRDEIYRMQQAIIANEKEIDANGDIQRQLMQQNQDLQKEFVQIRQEQVQLKKEILHEKEHAKKHKRVKDLSFKEKNNQLQMEIDHLLHENKRLHTASVNSEEMSKEFKFLCAEMQETIDNQKKEIAMLTVSNEKLKNTVEKNKRDSRFHKQNECEGESQQQLKDLRKQLKDALNELDDTKSRLSRAMGDKLTDNNPNIADLSDKNRPTKLSERYQELYDNQWTDAFEIINGKTVTEEDVIKMLRVTLMDTMEFCKEAATKQMNQITEALSKGKDLPANTIKQMKDCRKATAELYGKELFKVYLTKLKKEHSKIATKIPSFLTECFEICWLMAVQDPPVVFGPDVRQNSAFNKEHYKAYTKSGSRLAYVVWPVLLLHQDGPVLCKGVAQCC